MRTAVAAIQRGRTSARSMDRSSTTYNPLGAAQRRQHALDAPPPAPACQVLDCSCIGALALSLVAPGCKLLGSCRWAGVAPRLACRLAGCVSKAWRVAGQLNRSG